MLNEISISRKHSRYTKFGPQPVRVDEVFTSAGHY